MPDPTDPTDPTGTAGPQGIRLQPGDLVITAPPVEPVGRVDGVLETSRGLRLVIARAFAPRSYVILEGQDVAGVEDETGAGLRWVISRARPADLWRAGVYRRELGRLRPDPLPANPPPALDDPAAERALVAALRADPLLAGSEVTVGVRHGVALLGGWVRTVAAKVQTHLVARATPGIWEAPTRLASDEETRLCVRDALRARPELAEAVSAVEVDLGLVTVRLRAGAPPAVTADIVVVAGAAPGVRSVAATPEVAPE